VITEDDLDFLNSFEQCSLGSKCWNHSAHLRMGWLVLQQESTFDSALDRIRLGIKKFNSSNNSIGYHETITVAFARALDSRRFIDETWNDFSKRNSDLFEKNFLYAFYSPELLNSERARENFIDGDRQSLPLQRV
jgi:hypothetical protein